MDLNQCCVGEYSVFAFGRHSYTGSLSFVGYCGRWTLLYIIYRLRLFELSSHRFARQHYYLLFTLSLNALCILSNGYNVYLSCSFRSNDDTMRY